MKNRLVVLLAGLSLGVLAGCGAVSQEEMELEANTAGLASLCGDGYCNTASENSVNCPVDCGSGATTVLGRFSRWCGKVNSHTAPSGAWTPDSDCTSGCNIGGLAYCQKFWPGSVAIRQVPVSSKPASAWAQAGCYPANDEYDGSDEFECLGAPRVVGRFSRWCGKVNSHQSTGGAWTPDSDCTSGCNIGGLSYCQKFWPNTTSIRQVPVSSKPASAWAQAGCYPANDEYDGSDEFECVVD
ncbi:hypothetical protein JRI60_08050 [Archangium violaceum]|uniref:hypothetical protein n=1 Tax=Archangium violaceum TaxID=83451 RepID=UPI001951F480|nr:hypothetical protein [Archangium violaceum]QRN98969.1 hypothetical protein JRI60_08050 [Archangium violaceum]